MLQLTSQNDSKGKVLKKENQNTVTLASDIYSHLHTKKALMILFPYEEIGTIILISLSFNHNRITFF